MSLTRSLSFNSYDVRPTIGLWCHMETPLGLEPKSNILINNR